MHKWTTGNLPSSSDSCTVFNGGLATPSGASDAIDCNQARKAELVNKRKKIDQ